MDDIVFIGDWVKDRLLGSGSFGVVTLWNHKDTGEKLAVKTCKWGDELTEKHRERWTKEVEMLQNCNNRNIVGTKELPAEFIGGLEKANPSRLPILCMEYCSGGDLRQVLNKLDSSSGLKELEVRQILNDVCIAMQFLYNNKITHRDLKPENIVMQIIDPEENVNYLGNTHRKVIYKLIDLGYAKEIDSNSVCASFVGTLQYLAPEILYSKTYSNSVDFWSFGLLAFEIICGVRPFLPFLAPVQWIPLVKKKASDNICVYETYHGDIEYSNEIFPENQVSKPFKLLIEKWLRVALEWDPKLRGRDVASKGVTFNLPQEREVDPRSSNVIIFSMLEEILKKKIIKIFSISTLREIAYEINDSVNISTLKHWIQRDTDILIEEQILISPLTYININNDELVVNYWTDQCNTMMYLFCQNYIIKENVEPIVPKTVQRSLQQPKALYNYKNVKDLYKCSLHFVMSQKEIYDIFITGLFVRAETLKNESKQLLLKHNSVDKNISKLNTKEETVITMTETGKKHVKDIKDSGTGTNFLGGFDELFESSHNLTDKVAKLRNAWSHVTVRLQSAARRSNEVISTDLNNFVAKYNYQNIVTDAVKSYMNFKKNEREYRIGEKPCHEIMKICYNCLKMRSKILQEITHQTFILKLMDIALELAKIADVINTASENTDNLSQEISLLLDEFTQCLWSTISILSCAQNDEDLPYSVVSIQKRDFKIGQTVSNYGQNVNNTDELKSLIAESIEIRQNQSVLNNKIIMQKKILNDSKLDFSFLNEIKD